MSREGNPLQPGQEDHYRVVGKDREYFQGRMPGYIDTTRPLPAGEYSIYHAHLAYGLGGGCDGTIPEQELRRFQLIVQVEAPEWAVHEALFDPVQDGDAVAAGSSVGRLEPATLQGTDGASATIERIAWEGKGDSGAVTLRTAPSGGLSGHIIDFIALDGSVPLSLAVADATVQDGVLSWTVNDPPWQAGDKLMLRLRVSGQT